VVINDFLKRSIFSKILSWTG